MAIERVVEQAKVLTTYRQVRELVDIYLRYAGPVYLDTETTGLNPRQNRLVAIQLFMEGSRNAAILDARRLDLAMVAQELNRLFAAKVAVGHNLKFDINFLHAAGVHVGQVYDTELAERIIVGMGAQEGATFHLKDVAYARLRQPMSKAERAWFYKPLPLDQRPDEWNAPFPDEEVHYMSLDVTVLPGIKRQQETALTEAGLRDTFALEMRCLPAIAAMERTGIKVEVDGWRAFIAEKAQAAEALQAELMAYLALPILQARLKDYDKKRKVVDDWEGWRDAALEQQKAIWQEDPTDDDEQPMTWAAHRTWFLKQWTQQFPRPPAPKQDTTLPNINSTDQLLAGLQGLGIEVGSTKSQTLEQVDHPAARLLLQYRKAEKFVTSFGESLLSKVEADGRIHPEYRQIGAATGRMACTNPNWQQVPSRGDGKKLRALVVPQDGYRLVVADFSNIELRILADVSGDKTLTEMFESGLDLHSEMACRLFDLERTVDVKQAKVPGSDWTYRETAKTLNYGLVYGMSPVRLARMLHVEKEKAQDIFDAYFSVLPGVKAWLARQKEKGISDLQVRTVLGRKRQFLDVGPRPQRWSRAFNPDGAIPDGFRLLAELSKKDSDRTLVETEEHYRARLGGWLRAQGRVERQAGNSPIQGTSADITKLAVALFYEGHPIGSRKDHAQLVAVVHDELVVEAYQTEAEQVARRLEQCMDDAQHTYIRLSNAALPRPEAVISDHWTH